MCYTPTQVRSLIADDARHRQGLNEFADRASTGAPCFAGQPPQRECHRQRSFGTSGKQPARSYCAQHNVRSSPQYQPIARLSKRSGYSRRFNGGERTLIFNNTLVVTSSIYNKRCFTSKSFR